MDAIVRLPLKYSDPEGKGYCDALMPSQCRVGCDDKVVFECIGGDRVHIKWLGTFNNSDGACNEDLDRIAQNLYGWSFSRLNSVWYGRLGKFDGWYDLIKMEKV